MKYLEQTLAIYVYSHCNICNIPIYFCNIHMKHLQRTSETYEIIETYVCNIGVRGRCWSIPGVSVGVGGKRCASTTITDRARGYPLARPGMT